MRELIAKPLGLITQPNKVGEFMPGAMLRADGLRMKNPGELEPFKANSAWVAGAGSISSYVQRIFWTGSQLLSFKNAAPFLTNASFEVYWATAAGQNVASPVDALPPTFFPARIIPMVFRSRVLWNNREGVSVVDSVNPQNSTDRQFRWAGLPQPNIFVLNQVANGQFVNSNKTIGLAAVIKRVYTDGYELIGPVSAIQRFRNASASVNDVTLTVDFGDPTQNNVRAGDIVEVYRTREADAPSATVDVNPGTTVFQVASYTLTSTDIAFGFTSILLKAEANAVVGKELYSNPGQETLQSQRLPPPIAKTMAQYRGYAFYGNTTAVGSWAASFPSGIGLLTTATARLNGIGVRPFTTGTFTAGNPTITGISAAEMVGVQVGQYIYGPTRVPVGLPLSAVTATRVIAITATTITMSAPALSSGAPAPEFYTVDALEVDGTLNVIPDLSGLRFDLSNTTSRSYLLAMDTPVAPATSITLPAYAAFGQSFALSPMRYRQNSGVITVRGTNGQNYSPPIPLLTAPAQSFSPVTNKNYLWWSWEQQPECVPPGNSVPVGSGEIDALATTRDAMWVWASDGLYRFTGYGTRPSGIQANWRLDLIDARIRLAGPMALCAMNDEIFAYTNQGFVRVSDSRGLEYLSRGTIGDLIPGAAWSETPIYTMAADPVLNEVWLNVATPTLTVGDRILTIVWNNIYGVYTVLNQRVGDDNVLYLTAVDYAPDVGSMMLGLTVFGTASGQIDYHSPASNTYMAWVADFQPLYGPDPLSSKQWVDLTAIFDAGSSGKLITPRFNEVAGSYTNPVVLYPSTKDARVSFGVPQTAPAIAALIVPGLSGASSTGVTRLRAISPRFSVFSEQQLVR